ncbi:M14 family zinc carboxypeptidase [Photobacterium atrarenae]|uniref:Peptidase M14 n=1 Tax=Photobacterium atrarenae TaxID=865757 RepID=A0ABY5GNA7_9GAMM|nr:M14 family zinc carboxypeptidase [Photobacterium atrarenae]UTV30817.1 peptidase M14 [Photobacterium atrarenae]
MSQIFTTTISSSLVALVEQLRDTRYHGCTVEAWVFSDRASRRAAEASLRAIGVQARIRSAYKPLLHFFLEDVLQDGLLEPTAPSESADSLEAVEITYPVREHAEPKRFLLEAYPLAALIRCDNLTFTPVGGQQEYYTVTAHLVSGEVRRFQVFAPNHVHVSACETTYLSPTGWLRVDDRAGSLIRDEHFVTDYEKAFTTVMTQIQNHGWPAQGPYFEQLEIHVAVPACDEPMGYGHEVISLKEALHEDLYFSVQEWFKFREGKDLNARNSQPGQIIPLIDAAEGPDYAIEIRLGHHDAGYARDAECDAPTLALDTIGAPLPVALVEQALADIPGQVIEASAYSGRTVRAKYHPGADKAVMISGGQHANETTGVVGALRAATVLAQQADAHFVISPLENPDGYALHQALIQDNPHHMHHAARYTALGDDLEYRTGEALYEKAIRRRAVEHSGAGLHLNLHGYPSHEWTRPLSGYVPAGFEMWTIPKGFFLIVRHRDTPEWTDYAERFIHELTLALGHLSEVLALNRFQTSLYQQHAGETGFRIINDFPCLISAVGEYDVPLQIITEYPDETIYGADFIAGHDVQSATVLAAYQIHQRLSQPEC